MVEMSCEEHDRQAASTQFVTHTVGAQAHSRRAPCVHAGTSPAAARAAAAGGSEALLLPSHRQLPRNRQPSAVLQPPRRPMQAGRMLVKMDLAYTHIYTKGFDTPVWPPHL